MAEMQNSAQRSGKTQTLNEVLMQLGYLQPDTKPATQDELLVALLYCTQRLQVNLYGFMVEPWDWLVALQWMQDNAQFKSNPKRPPFAAFNLWLKNNKVPQLHEQCSVRNLTYVNKKIAGARYPWTEVMWEPSVLRRWRVMYRLMGMIWNALLEHNEVLRNKALKHD